ncbi:MAG: outer membrane protein transport protein [Muribaculaceae bacterium]|nr:outer membrane protein transport protein [Muribaculaceae bacterium]
MKRTLTSVAAVATALIMWAEGYQINTLSAKQEGMGHVGVAMKLGAESMIFNPAGLSFSDKTIDLSASITGIKADATAIHNGTEYKTDNGISTPMAINASFRIYDNLQCGIAFYTPYGSSINWGDNWPGAVLNQKVDLKTFTLQPTFSWRITPRLSVGAGLMLAWGSVDLNKGLVSASSMDGLLTSMGMPAMFGQTTPASVNIKGTADIAVGVNLGAMYDINDRVTVGINWRSKMTAKVSRGDASVSYATENEQIKALLESKLNLINNANFRAEMPMPQTLTFGVSYKPVKPLILAFDAQFTGWSTYKHLDIDFLDEHLTDFDQHLEKKYRNAWCFHLGAQYALTHRFDIRAGMMIDTTPVNSSYYNPETPGMTKIEPSVGFSFRPVKGLSVDFALMYVAGLGEDNATVTYRDFLTNSDKEFKADYRVHAIAPSLGLSYAF